MPDLNQNNKLSPGDVCTVLSIIEDEELILKRKDGMLFHISQGWYDDDFVNNGIQISDGYKEDENETI